MRPGIHAAVGDRFLLRRWLLGRLPVAHDFDLPLAMAKMKKWVYICFYFPPPQTHGSPLPAKTLRFSKAWWKEKMCACFPRWSCLACLLVLILLLVTFLIIGPLVGDANLVFEIIVIFYRKISCASSMARSHNLHLPSPPPFSQPSRSVFLVAPGIVQRTVDDTVMHISGVDMLDPSAASVLMAINSTIVKTSHITCTIAGFNATLKVWSGKRQYRAWVRAPTHGSGDCCCEPPCPC